MAGSGDLGKIHLQQQIALLDLIAHLDLGAEAVALHLDGIHADVDQHLDIADALDAQCVAAVRGLGDLAVDGGVDLALGGVNAAALAQDALCKNLIGDLLHRHHGALGIGSQHQRESRGGGGSGVSRLFQKIKKSHLRYSPLQCPAKWGTVCLKYTAIGCEKQRKFAAV